jgi:hypothetical protein
MKFLAEFTQHIPPKGSHLIRYYGWYSNKARGMRRKAAEAALAAQQAAAAAAGQPSPTAAPLAAVPVRSRSSPTWAMLIKRIFEVDPLACPQCGSEMRVVAFLEPPQGDVIEKILRHCGLWNPSAPRAPPRGEGLVYVPDVDGGGQTAFCEGRGEVVYVPDADGESQTASCDEPWEVTCADEDAFEAAF